MTLKEVRDQFGLAQAEIARRTGLSLAGVSAMEHNNTVPTRTTCKKMAKAYGVPAFVLRTLAVLAAEDTPDAGPNRELFLSLKESCKQVVINRANGKKK